MAGPDGGLPTRWVLGFGGVAALVLVAALVARNLSPSPPAAEASWIASAVADAAVSVPLRVDDDGAAVPSTVVVDEACLVQHTPSGWQAQRPPGPPTSSCPADWDGVELPVTTGEGLVLAVAGDLRARTLVETHWFTGEGSLQLVVDGGGTSAAAPPSAVTLHWMPRPVPGQLPQAADQIVRLVLVQRGAERTLYTDDSTSTPESRADMAVSLSPASRSAARTEGGAQRTRTLLIPGPEWTVQDLVSSCLTVRSVLAGAAGRVLSAADEAAVPCVISPETPSEFARRLSVRNPQDEGSNSPVGVAARYAPARDLPDVPVGGQPVPDPLFPSSITPTVTVLDGPIPADHVEEVLGHHALTIEGCVSMEGSGVALGEGRLELAFTVDAAGEVSSVTIVESSLANPEIEGCIARRFDAMQLGALPDDTESHIGVVLEVGADQGRPD